MNMLAQYFFNKFNSPVKQNIFKWCFLRLGYKIFKKSNPLVKGVVNDQIIYMPFNHMLLKYQSMYKNYDTRLKQLNDVLSWGVYTAICIF